MSRKPHTTGEISVKTYPHLHKIVQFTLLSILILLVGGSVLLWQSLEGGQGSQASGASVVGQPTLPAATVNRILASTPMAGTGSVVEQAARAANVDDAFALAVWYVETNQGAAGVGSADRNPGSVKSSSCAGCSIAFDGYTIYPSYAAAIQDWFRIIQSRYISRGLTTVYSIAGPYVGTSSSGLWAGKVMRLMTTYRNEAPPPPTPTPSTLKYRVSNLPKAHQQPTSQPQQQPQPTAVTNTAPQNVPATQPSVSPQQSSTQPVSRQLLVVGGGLAVALVLALFALSIRRRRSAVLPAAAPAPIAAAANVNSAPALQRFEPETGDLVYAPFNVAALSPTGDEQMEFPPAAFSPAAQAAFIAERDTDKLAPVHPEPSWPLMPEPALAQEVAPAAPMRRMLLLPSRLAPAPAWGDDGAPGHDTGEREPVLVGAAPRPAGGGLLSRYGKQ